MAKVAVPPVKFSQISGINEKDRTEAIFARSGQLTFGGVLRPTSPGPGQPKTLALFLRNGIQEIHPLLGPTTPIWGYTADSKKAGQWPGPTIEVNSGDRVRVQYYNQLAGTIGDNYQHVQCGHDTPPTPSDPATPPPTNPNPMNEAGRWNRPFPPVQPPTSAVPDSDVAAISPWTIAHLHGAPTVPDSDGWTDNVAGANEKWPREHTYDFPRETYQIKGKNGKPKTIRGGAAPFFWYHDHAMGITRFNVFSGLAGGWIVRDPLEKALNLPKGDFELPLVLQDRNLDTSDGNPDSDLTGHLIHKVQTDTSEFFGPCNVVNGKLWPNVAVKPQVYRLRIVCGCNARTFQLHFLARKAAGAWAELPPKCVQQIGTDGGLLGKAADVPGLTMAPGERADVLIDFGAIKKLGYDSVTVFNLAKAPWDAGDLAVDVTTALKDGSPDDLLLIPEVMRFNIGKGNPQPGLKGKPIYHMRLDPEFTPLDHDMLPDHMHPFIVLREEDQLVLDDNGQPILTDPNDKTSFKKETMLHLHEMAPVEIANGMGMNMHALKGADGTPLGIGITAPAEGKNASVTYVTVAKRFTDMTYLFFQKDSWAVWKILDLTPDTHPFHIHLVQFQALKRTVWTPSPAPAGKMATEYDFSKVPVTDLAVDKNEKGWKDTVRANPGDRKGDDIYTAQLIEVAAQFSPYAGKYMYHCHILEHEDLEMMRPYVVVPAAMMPKANSMVGMGSM